MPKFTALETYDIRFPTSRYLHGSDAMNRDPDYSAAYVVLRCDDPDLSGHGFAFTIGRGNDVQTAAVAALSPLVIGQDVDAVINDLGAFARELTSDSQLRWLGPEKGVIHMATGAVVNAAWDMAARRAKKPVWRLLADMTPQELVRLIDFRYITDALTPEEALAILKANEATKATRINQVMRAGYPAYTTSAGWIGYTDPQLVELAVKAVKEGFQTIKLKVGLDLGEDIRRCRLAREAIGTGIGLAIDANQRWGVDDAVYWLRQLAPYQIAWAEEPTSPDDILGHARIRRSVAPMPVSTGEHTHNRVMFKQLFQAQAVDIIQIDAARVNGVSENLAILLMAAKFGVRVYPHGGGVGLCELVQHLAIADYIAISGTMSNRAIEFVNHLHEHFVNPAIVQGGRYVVPTQPGFSADMHWESLIKFRYPSGDAWNK